MNIAIFNCDNYQAFSIDKAYEEICDLYYPSKEIKELNANGCFIAPKSWVEEKQQADYTLVDLHPETQSNLIFGSFNKINDSSVSEEFKQAIIQLFINWQKNFCHWIHQHLSSRMIDGKKVTEMTHLQQLIAQLIENFKLLDVLRKNDSSALYVSANICRANGDILMKLPGGRAFLAGSVLELVWTFEAFYNVYFYC